MTKIDFKKTLPSYLAKVGKFEIIDVPPLQYLMIDGHGDPNAGGPFAEAVSALFSVGYKLKFASKIDLGLDYAVMPLEGLWSSADPSTFTSALDKSTWDWTLAMMVPDWITTELFSGAQEAARRKGGTGVERLRLEVLAEGRCVQILHLGSFDEEGPVLHQLHTEFVPANGLTLGGRHHEIYLSDFTKTAPAKLRTILRQPVSVTS
ncbi:GyrI-like domain-containing protein [Propionicimonas sp.]|uniref:GyrI-like domain-containing protein n=1 Tax=Propionicimonas sp. TaxID=1955623 RepID=UPI0017A3A171|nr:GyrI-like domain-containing protein [Propionicimonas sp.]MBU3977555.1 GyrI-like domain-containing protein [Actinomycetota bacterium]MBA3021480.1 hypothetical protein [Propionicimonas sp.]MBU3987029.1 GyrI-like domain-containing protein [Actinomycetota bacterium]MBU4008850.1 GyrI-like domain-containing protein [Actinomycetota bacterium]MBU4066000.1 GyrI-like domain-containing protein [Actinomycetota bacterium]